MCEDDIELTVAALKACGYRVKLREKNYTRWVTATKGVQFKHWHPLTNINQAMQLLIDCPHGRLTIDMPFVEVTAARGGPLMRQDPGNNLTPQDLIDAQCRAIVSACAALKAVP